MKTQFLSAPGKVRLVISLTVIFILSMTATFAQQRGPGMGRGNATPEERAKRQTDRMKDVLKLTASQEPKVLAINLKYANKMEDARKIADTTAQRKAFLNLSKQQEAEFKGILTPDQMKGYQKLAEERMARQRQMQH